MHILNPIKNKYIFFFIILFCINKTAFAQDEVQGPPPFWKIKGNSGTIAPSVAIGTTVNNYFLGTTDAIDFAIAISGFERLRVLAGGKICIGGNSTSFNVTQLNLAGGFFVARSDFNQTFSNIPTFMSDQSDAALFYQTTVNGTLHNLSVGSETRLYIEDDANDNFSIYGNSCATGCFNLSNSLYNTKFFGNGDVQMRKFQLSGLKKVYADANGVLYSGVSGTTNNIWKNTTAGSYTFTVPAGITSIKVYLIGGGGGSVYCISNCGGGGAGAYVKGTLEVTPGENLTVVVGAAGNGAAAGGTTTGGGASYILRGSTYLCAAGGGGGGSYSNSSSSGCGGGAGSWWGGWANYGTVKPSYSTNTTLYNGNNGNGSNSGTSNAYGGSNYYHYLDGGEGFWGDFSYNIGGYRYTIFQGSGWGDVTSPAFSESVIMTEIPRNTGRSGQHTYNSSGTAGAVLIMY